jgi:hypothetical protein
VRRARLLVSAAAVAAVVTAVLLALLVAGLVGRTGSAPALLHGLAALGTAGVAIGLLMLARAGALARGRSTNRARALYARSAVAAGATGLAAVLAGALTAPSVRSPLPAWGGALAGFPLALLVALALGLRAATSTTGPTGGRPQHRGDEGESEPDRAARAR